MANLSELTENVAYACKCLNVRITPSTPPSDPPDYPPSKDYVPVFVADDGILVAHPQVTVRISTKGEPIPGTSRCSRFTAVTCLFCDIAIYRVHQIISEEVDLKDSVLLPTEEWVEHDVMKSASGWIDVHKDALSREKISQAQSSPDYASIFSLLLPSTSTSPSSLRKSLAKDDVQLKPPKEESHEEPTIPNYLSDMLPLYLPPPFTPSHPIFALLADIADKESKRLRSEAERRVANFIKTEIAGVEAMEQSFRSQVEALWKSFRGHLNEVQERNQRHSTARSPVRGSERFSTNGVVSPARMSSSVTVRSFVPVSVNPVSHPPTVSSVPRVSALSASLATSSFHHPRHSQSQSPTGPVTRSSVESSSSKTLSSTPSGSSTLVQGNHLVEGHTIINLKRNVDDTVNTQASFRYFVNLEEDMARHKRQQEEALTAQGTRQTQETQPGPSTSVSGSVGRKPKKTQATGRTSSRDKPALDHDAGPTRGRDKGKRKVTFDVEPAVVTIQTNQKVAGDEKEAASSEDPREMIFPMEDLENSTNSDINEHTTAMSLPLVEQPAARPPRPRKLRSPNTTALLESFASLRPSSLPNPSYIRSVRSSPGMDSSQSITLSLPRASNIPPSAETSQTTSKASSTVPSPTALSERDIELRKLVAADTPSHRGAWTPESKAWQMFSRRQSSKEEISQSGSTGEPESPEGGAIHITKRSVPSSREDSHDDDENHFDESRPMVAGSLPVNINRVKPREPLSLASYKAPNTITEEPQDPAASASAPAHAQKPLSSAAIRKATYLERDRSRSMDPGTLDFPSEEEEEDTGGESDVVENETVQSGERGRKKALKILQARSELPEEGMWRSLANDAPVL